MPAQVLSNVRMCGGVGKFFSGMLFEPGGPGQSQHGPQGLENFLSFGEPIFIEVGHPTGLWSEEVQWVSVRSPARVHLIHMATHEIRGNLCISEMGKPRHRENQVSCPPPPSCPWWGRL